MAFELTVGNRRIFSVGFRKQVISDAIVSGTSIFGATATAEKNQSQALRENRGWVYKAVNKISKSVSAAELELYVVRGSKETPVTDHPFFQVWENPNIMFSGRMLRELLQTHLELAGEMYALIISDGLGMPKEMWPLQPDYVDIKVGRDGSYSFKYQPPGKPPIFYAPEDIWYQRYPHPTKALRGRSPLQATSLEYDTDKLIEEYYWTLFKEGGWFHYALSTDQTVTETQAKQIQSAWMNKLRTKAGKFGAPVLQKGLKITQLKQSAADLGTKEKSLELRDKILSAYGVPRGLLGITEGLPRANLDGAEYMFAKDTIKPRLDLWTDGLAQPLSRYRMPVKARFKNIVPQDREALRQETDMLLARGAISLEEARERHGMEPGFRSGDTVLVPLNLLPQPKEAERIVVKDAQPFWTSDRKDAYWLKFAMNTEARERKWVSVVKSWIDAWESDVLAGLKKDLNRYVSRYAGWGEEKVRADIEKQDLSDILPDKDTYENMILDKAGKLHRADYKAAAEEAIAFIGIGIDFNMDSPAVISYLGDKSRKFAVEQVKRLSDELTMLLTTGFIEGDTIADMSAGITELYQMERTYRAQRIARTEVISASNRGKLEGYKQASVGKKAWLSSRDSDVRDSHVTAEAEYGEDGEPGPIGLDDNFIVGAGSGPCPGEIGVAEEDIQCRCTFRPIVQEGDES